MNVPDGNEMDVRAELAEPFLAALGYRRGTSANIDREYRLTRDRHRLGRQKKTDKPVIGKADYRLSVIGYGHWVLDAKSGKVDVDREAIEQAISYAAHPEVAGHYAAILSGTRFVLYRKTQSSHEAPVIDLAVTTGEALAKALTSILSPAAIRRDCKPPIVDLGTPISEGLRSAVQVAGGIIQYDHCEWVANVPVPPSASKTLDELCRRLSSYRANVTGGRIWRDENSRIVAKLKWSAPEPTMVQFAIDKKLFDTQYVCLDESISQDFAQPAYFDSVGQLSVQQGEKLFNFLSWQPEDAAIASDVGYMGHAMGAINDLKSL